MGTISMFLLPYDFLQLYEIFKAFFITSIHCFKSLALLEIKMFRSSSETVVSKAFFLQKMLSLRIAETNVFTILHLVLLNGISCLSDRFSIRQDLLVASIGTLLSDVTSEQNLLTLGFNFNFKVLVILPL